MDPKWISILIVCIGVIAVWKGGLLRPKNTKLNWELFSTLLRDRDQVRKLDISDRNEFPGADVQIQFLSGSDSVKYYRSQNRNGRTETLDVLRRGESGFLITFDDEVPTFFTRIGGVRIPNPEFPPNVRTVLLGLLRRVRDYADEE